MSKLELNELKDLIEQLFLGSVAGNLPNRPVKICRLTDSGKTALEKLSGLTFKDQINFCLHPSDLRHIYQRHYGNHESVPQQLHPLTIEDIRNIADVLMLPDEIIYLGADNNGKKFAFFLENEDGCWTIIEVYAQKKGNLTAKTFYNAIDGRRQMDLIVKKAMTSNNCYPSILDSGIPILIEPVSSEEKPDATDGLETPSHTSETVPGE